MYFNNQLIIAFAIAYGADMAIAISHGEFGEFDGLAIRYQQVAQDVFAGIPVDAWNDIDHHRSDEVWDFNSPVSRSLDNDVTTELEDRDLKDTCSLAVECARLVGRMTIEYGYLAWVAAAERAKPAGQSLMQFLNQPFWANSGGVAIAGIISNAVNGAAKCSTSNNEADLVKAAIAEAVKVNPNAGKIKATVQGPGGSWTITIEAGSNNRPTC